MNEPIIFVTSSDGKFREASRLAPFSMERADIDLVEPQTLDVAVAVRAKAAAAYSILARPLLVEDTSLELSALGGFPGPLVKWLLVSSAPDAIPRLLAAFDDRRATARAAIAFADDHGVFVVNGSVPGSIVFPKGENGFGWDSVFKPEGQEKTYAEMEPDEKDARSHRGRAFAALAEALAQRERDSGRLAGTDLAAGGPLAVS